MMNSYLPIVLYRGKCVHDELEEVVEDVGLLHYLVLQHHQVHQDVADGRHRVLGVHHLELGVVDDVEGLRHVCVILRLRLVDKLIVEYTRITRFAY